MFERTPESVPWQRWGEVSVEFGETPTWDARLGALYSIDVYGPAVVRDDGSGSPARVWVLPDMPGSIALTPDPETLLVALTSGIHLLDIGSGVVTTLHPAPYDTSLFRFNDGRCDRAGRFWVGTNRQPGSGQPRGSAGFYRLDDRGLHGCIGGVTIANGLAFSPDDRTLYQADVVTGRVLAYDYELGSGEVSNERTFVDLPEKSFPDGAAVDARGGYWIAMYGAGLIVRYTPSGELDRVVRAPTSYPTMMSFGGPGSGLAFVTTGRRFTPPDVLEREPLAGAVFCADLGAVGLAEPYFAF